MGERTHFPSLAALRLANEGVGGAFFESDKLAGDERMELVGGRWVLAVKRGDGGRTQVYEALPDGHIRWAAEAADWQQALDVVAAVEAGDRAAGAR